MIPVIFGALWCSAVVACRVLCAIIGTVYHAVYEAVGVIGSNAN